MTVKGYITIDGKKIKIIVKEDVFFKTIDLRAGQLGKHLPIDEQYFKENRGQLKKLFAGEKIVL